MKTLIQLERLPSAPKFIDERGGKYDNPLIKLYKNHHDLDDFLKLSFGFFLDESAVVPIFQISLIFDGDKIPQLPNPEGGLLELGKPNYIDLLADYLEFGTDGRLYLINPEGMYWFLNTPLCNVPNSLGETNLSNWKFKSVN